MRHAKEEPSSSTELHVLDFTSAVKELNGLSSQELSKLIKDSENNVLQRVTENGSLILIDVEKLARSLPLHLIGNLISNKRDETLFKYLLSGLRLLHTLCDLAPRHSKLEQILLDDVKVSEQLIDLIFYLIISLGSYRQEHHPISPFPLVYSTLVACSLYLLTGCISSQWPDLAQVLLAHPKVDVFMDAAFAAICMDVKFIQIKLSTQCKDFIVEETLSHLFQQCEASMQFFQLLCQQKLFRERIVKNKELCGKGGILVLARAILSLNVPPLFRESFSVVAAVSRLKSKVLSVLLHLCEAESMSYLDEVASIPQTLDLAKSVALKVIELLGSIFNRDPKQISAHSDRTCPTGLVQLNAMGLADIFSDDSNFRSYITIYFTEVLAAIFTLPHGEFLSNWCSSELPIWEEDANLEYDPFTAAGWMLDSFPQSQSSNATNSGSTFVPSNTPRASYAHQRTSLLVKIIANLHCFVPDILKEEKDIFLNKFLKCLEKKLHIASNVLPFPSNNDRAAIVTRNLRSLLSHAESLIPTFLNEDDVQLLRVFFSQLEALLTPAEFGVDRVQVTPDNINRSSNLKEGISDNSAFPEVDQFYVRSDCLDQAEDVGRKSKGEDVGKLDGLGASGLREIDRDIENIEISGSDSSTTREKNSMDQTDKVFFTKSSENIKESGFGGVQEEKFEPIQSEEKQQRKRKRSIMNAKQINLIEKALLDEPDMQRSAASVQSWADKLSVHGSEVTTSQLKNWLNNRKARLARAAAKDIRTPVIATEGGENASYQEKPGGGGGGGTGNSSRCGSPEEDMSSLRETTATPTTMGEERTMKNSHLRSSVVVVVDEEDEDDISAPLCSGIVQCEPGRYVVLVDGQGEEIGKGKVFQVRGLWYGRNLDEEEGGTKTKKCVVDVIELKAERWARLPYACEATGNSFAEAETKLGLMRVLWDSNKLFMLQQQQQQHRR